jgi:hypothetical protein
MFIFYRPLEICIREVLCRNLGCLRFSLVYLSPSWQIPDSTLFRQCLLPSRSLPVCLLLVMLPFDATQFRYWHCRKLYRKHIHIFTRRGYVRLIITRYGLDDWVYWHFCYNYTWLQSLITSHNRRLHKARSVSSWTTTVYFSMVAG